MGMEFVSMYVRYDANITRTTGESFNKFSSFFQVSFLPLESSKHQNVFIIDVRKCVIYISINYKKNFFFALPCATSLSSFIYVFTAFDNLMSTLNCCIMMLMMEFLKKLLIYQTLSFEVVSI